MRDETISNEEFDRRTINEPWTATFFAARLRFKIDRALFSHLVGLLIGRAYERSILNSQQMHSLRGMWERMCCPERRFEKESFDSAVYPPEPRWFRKSERKPEFPCVFAFFGVGRDPKYFTLVYEESRGHADLFINSDAWTHWHPLSKTPNVALEAALDQIEEEQPPA